MPLEFKVVPFVQLFPWPGVFTKEYEAEFARRFEEALNQKAAEGWMYVGTYLHHAHSGGGYAAFRREE